MGTPALIDVGPLRASSATQGTRAVRALKATLIAGLLVAASAFASPASAQFWPPWGSNDRPPVPREPVRPQPPPQAAPPPAYSPQPGASQPNSNPNFGTSAASGGRPPICYQLEQRLVSESRSTTAADALPRIENEMRQTERAMRSAQEQLDRSNCYEYEFLMFGKSLKPTPQCRNGAAQVDNLRRKVAELDAQRQSIVQSGGRSLQDDIVRELARNNCGPRWQQEASRNSNPFSSLWQDEEGGAAGRNQFNYGATFRTVCVRLCDGAFFPVSFSTLPNHFDRDQDACQQKCAAPAELYYYNQDPKAGIDQAISHKTRQPYTTLRTAFRFRKEFVNGCSCKAAEFVPPGTSVPGPAVGTERRAEAASSAGGQAPPPAGPPLSQPPPRR